LLAACSSSSDDELDGATLFSGKGCTQCHGSGAVGIENLGPDIRGKNSTNVSNAINNVAAMSDYKGQLTTDEINAIGGYLSGLGASGKLMKPVSVLNVSAPSGWLIVKDNNGTSLDAESDNGEYQVDISGMQAPIVIQSVDADDFVLYGLSDGQGLEVEISLESDEALYDIADVGTLFDECEPDSEGCFDELVVE
jgi:hypothetical protein